MAKKEKKGGKTYSRLEHIDDETLEKIIEKLNEMLQESQEVIAANLEADAKMREENAEVGDDLDKASNERARELSLIIHQRHLRRLQQIEEAFERIKDQTYGYCEETDEPINPKRLLIMPLARYSIEYQSQQEKIRGRSLDEESFIPGEDSFSSDD